jgi:hypothetical protein
VNGLRARRARAGVGWRFPDEEKHGMKTIRIVALVFSVVGIGLVGGCVWAIRAARFPHAVHATGRVVGMQRTLSYESREGSSWGYVPMYAPTVEFETPEGTRRFTSHVSSNKPGYAVGEAVEVAYPEGEPGRARINRFMEIWFPMVVLTPLTLCFGGVGLGLSIYVWRRRRLDRWLARFGVRVKAVYIGAQVDGSITYNGRSPWRLECEWTDDATRQRHRMRSEALWQDPRAAVRGGTLDVLINPADPRQYRVDIDFLSPPPRRPANASS